MSQPYIRFFGCDWRSDPALRLCSAAARGVWIDCISLMMEAEPYGHLVTNSRPTTPEQLSILTATPLKIVRLALKELAHNGVISTTDDGLIYSRRMVRDAEKLALDRANGKTGGNPKLRGEDKPKTHPPVNPPHRGGLTEEIKHARSTTTPTPIPTASAADARAAAVDLHELGPRVLALIGIDEARSTLSYQRVGMWLSQGADPELDIVPAIRDAMAKRPGKVPNSLSYFDGAISDWRADRLKNPPALNGANGANGHAGPRKPPTRQELIDGDWPAVLKAWRARGTWLRNAYGPAPGELGCKVPEHLLEPTQPQPIEATP